MAEFRLSRSDCDEIISKSFKIEASTCDFEVIPRQNGNCIVKITVERDAEEETFCLFAKPKSSVPRIDKILYEDFKSAIPTFNPTFTPKFYCIVSEWLVFEDLTCQRFQVQREFFTKEHLHLCLNVLAKFHAAGFVYENVKGKSLKDEYDLEEFTHSLNEVQKCHKFKKTLCHGNLTSSNMLFDYNHGIPSNCKLINCEANLYAPPLYDVLQLILFNTSEDFQQQLASFLQYYENSLKDELKEYSFNMNSILSSEELQESSNYLLPLIKLEIALANKSSDHDN